jgi:hypothetical protein
MPHAFSAAWTFGLEKRPRPAPDGRTPEGRGRPGVRVKLGRGPVGVGTAIPAACRHDRTAADWAPPTRPPLAVLVGLEVGPDDEAPAPVLAPVDEPPQPATRDATSTAPPATPAALRIGDMVLLEISLRAESARCRGLTTCSRPLTR